ncbi:MAG TPA: CRTAC1 family protein [Gemmataceae bacterium]|jgi:hypothetical protein
MTTTCQESSRRAALVLAAVLLLLCAACTGQSPGPLPSSGPSNDNDSPRFFRDATADSGVRFTYRNGEEAGHHAILEVIGGGLAALDFDGDGRLDLFLIGGGYYDGPDKQQIKGYPCKLFHNVGTPGGGFRFEDVTAAMGLEKIDFYSHGAAVGDFDTDGWPDLLVTGWQRLALFHNEPVDAADPSKGRKFVEVTSQAGLPNGLWTTGAAWGDLDGDGYPDLYLCQYVDWSFRNNPPCTVDEKQPDVCPPTKFKGLEHKLFRNRGDGTFADVSKSAGLLAARLESEYAQLDWLDDRRREQLRQAADNYLNSFGAGLGALLVDINGDGKPEIYVTNDMRDNYLYVNRTRQAGTIQLEELGLESGTARNALGLPDASMGVDASDYDGCGRPSLWVTNYASELHALYRNECRNGRILFTHSSIRAGIAADRNSVGWGTGFLDLEHRGWEDIFLTAGDAFLHSPTLPRAQKAVLFRNQGNGKFVLNSARGGPYFQSAHVGRGAVLADFDNDGRIDLAISYLNEPVTLLRNEADTGGHHWLGVELCGTNHRDLVGARVILESGGRTQTRFAKGGGSYLSSNDRRLVFGLGAAEHIDRLRVVWPSGPEQEWKGLAGDRYWRLTQGQQRASPLSAKK